MPTSSYLTAHQSAKWARLTRSSFLAYRTSLGLSGGCEHSLLKAYKLVLRISPKNFSSQKIKYSLKISLKSPQKEAFRVTELAFILEL